LLPFAEWKFIGLPLRGRPFSLILTVIYLFHLLIGFCFICLCLHPPVVALFQGKIIHELAFGLDWLFAVYLLSFFISISNQFLPYLAPSSPNVIDIRSLIIHFALALFVTIALIQIPLVRIIKGYKYSIL
jgi:hypothetical protein